MKDVEYVYCPHCGMEWLDGTTLEHIGRYANGEFLRCPECDGSIGEGDFALIQEQQAFEDEDNSD